MADGHRVDNLRPTIKEKKTDEHNGSLFPSLPPGLRKSIFFSNQYTARNRQKHKLILTSKNATHGNQ